MQLSGAFMESFITQIRIKRVTLNYIYQSLCLSLTESTANISYLLNSIAGLDFGCTSLALLKPHLHTKMCDDTLFSYFIN